MNEEAAYWWTVTDVAKILESEHREQFLHDLNKTSKVKVKLKKEPVGRMREKGDKRSYNITVGTSLWEQK